MATCSATVNAFISPPKYQIACLENKSYFFIFYLRNQTANKNKNTKLAFQIYFNF